MILSGLENIYAMVKYTTVATESTSEAIIEKSRFIAHVKRVDSREDAEKFIYSIRKEYKDATHNVPAYVIGEKQDIQWASDDGEPSGTSGAPILQMIVKEGLTNIVVVVTRYYGGIKLGTGGLVRAYTGVSREALKEAGRFDVKDFMEITIKSPYQLLSKIQNTSKELDYEISSIRYEDELIITISFESENRDIIIQKLSDISSGKIVIVS